MKDCHLQDNTPMGVGEIDRLGYEFGKILKEYRQVALLSQEELAFRCGLDRTFISMLERGKRIPTIKTVFLIAKELGYQPSILIKTLEDRMNR